MPVEKANYNQHYFSYEVMVQEDKDHILIPIPKPLLEELQWKEGEEIAISMDQEGKFVFKKS